MMNRIFAMVLLTLAFAPAAFAECSDKQALEAFDRAWGDAGRKGDRNALMTIYADDYVGLPDMQNKTQTIDATMKAFQADQANPGMADKISHDNYMITCTSASAVITHRNIITAKNASGNDETFWTRSVHFLEKRGGKWQVVGNAGNGMDEYAMLGYMERDWNTADMSRDISWFEKNFASDYTSISSGSGKLFSKSEEIADMRNDKRVVEAADLSEVNIRIDGNTAIVTGVNHVKGRDGDAKPFDYKLRFTDTFIKRDGRWQVWASQGTRIP